MSIYGSTLMRCQQLYEHEAPLCLLVVKRGLQQSTMVLPYPEKQVCIVVVQRGAWCAVWCASVHSDQEDPETAAGLAILTTYPAKDLTVTVICIARMSYANVAMSIA